MDFGLFEADEGVSCDIPNSQKVDILIKYHCVKIIT
jgi:hypothetical protein